jgi:hypothetical protein
MWLLPAQRWTDVQVLDLPACGRAAIKGKRPTAVSIFYCQRIHPSLIDVREQGTDQGSSVCVVVPCSLSESISTSWYVVMVVLTLHLLVFNASVGFTLLLPASSLHLQRFMWPLPQKTRRQSTIRSARASSSLLYRKTFRRSTMSVGRGA